MSGTRGGARRSVSGSDGIKATAGKADTKAMSKRALLWSLGGIAFGFTFLAAMNAGGQYRYFHNLGFALPVWKPCNGFSGLMGWFAQGCVAVLPERLGVISLGVAALLVCGYFAEKKRVALKSAGHMMKVDFAQSRWVCKNCDFETSSRTAARQHRFDTGQVRSSIVQSTAPTNAHGSGSPTQPIPAPDDGPTPAPMPAPSLGESYKTCPDCAEEVRHSARKCRFCGFRFETADEPSGDTGSLLGPGLSG